MTHEKRGSRRGGIRLALAGAVIAWAAMLAYFLVVPKYWPSLRDSALPNVILGCGGVFVAALGLVRSIRARRWHRLTLIVFLIATAPTSFLLHYVYVLSYKLPPTTNVVHVGSRAPAFALQDQNGRTRRLDEFAGKPIVLLFFRGHW